jgi:hypothetical protein
MSRRRKAVVAIAIVSVILAAAICRLGPDFEARQRRSVATKKLEERGATLCHSGATGRPTWANALLESFGPVVEIRLNNVTDEDLAYLRNFKQVRKLSLGLSHISDAGLVPIRELEQLESLDLYGNSVTGKGLEHLKSLPRLRVLYIGNTDVTSEEVLELRADLPNVKIYDGR